MGAVLPRLLFATLLLGACGRVSGSTPPGEACGNDDQCASGFCVDAVCCATACEGACMACSASAGAPGDGTCAPVVAESDPANECGGRTCDGTGACFTTWGQGKTCFDASECRSGHCRDGVCCDATCDATCESCRGSETGGSDGTCGLVLELTDPADECDFGVGCRGDAPTCKTYSFTGLSERDTGASGGGNIGGSENSGNPQIAVNGAGDSFAVWTEYHAGGARYNAWYARWNGTAWVLDILEDSNTSIGDVDVAINTGGQAAAIYTLSASTGNVVYTRRWNPGTQAWTDPVHIGKTDEGPATNVWIGIDDSGNVIAAWQYDTDATSTVWYNRFSSSAGGWGVPYPLTTANHTFHNLAVSRDGSAVALFSYKATGLLQAKYYAPLTDWQGNDSVCASPIPGPIVDPYAAIDDVGNVFVAWGQNEDAGGTLNSYRLHLNYRVRNGGWTGPIALEGTGPTATFNSHTPQIALTPAGTAIIIWHRWIADKIFATTWDPATSTAGTPTPIMGDEQYPLYPRIATDGFGNAIAIWHGYLEEPNGVYEVMGNRYVAGLGWTTPFTVSYAHTDSVEEVAIGLDDRGRASLAWAVSGSGTAAVWTARFE